MESWTMTPVVVCIAGLPCPAAPCCPRPASLLQGGLEHRGGAHRASVQGKGTRWPVVGAGQPYWTWPAAAGFQSLTLIILLVTRAGNCICIPCKVASAYPGLGMLCIYCLALAFTALPPPLLQQGQVLHCQDTSWGSSLWRSALQIHLPWGHFCG